MGREVIVRRDGVLRIDVKANKLNKRTIAMIQDQLILENTRISAGNAAFHGNEDATVKAYWWEGNDLILPRFFAQRLRKTLNWDGRRAVLKDYSSIVPVKWPEFRGKLRRPQQKAVDAFVKSGVCCIPTGGGKCLVGMMIAKKLGQKLLVIINTIGVIDSWVKDAAKFFGMPEKSIGIIQEDKTSIGTFMTIASVKTLSLRNISSLKDEFGVVITDEVHHMPCDTFVKAVSQLSARYRLGLSATPRREDGLDELIFWHMGNMYYKTADTEGTVPMKFGVVVSDMEYDGEEDIDDMFNYARFIDQAIYDTDRNHTILGEIKRGIQDKRKILLVTNRKKHVKIINDMCLDARLSTVELTSQTKNSTASVIEGVIKGKHDIVNATLQLVLEGINCPPWDMLVIATPFRSSIQVEQVCGRIRRNHPGKRMGRIIDIIDVRVPQIKRMGLRRLKIYYDLGFTKVKLKR